MVAILAMTTADNHDDNDGDNHDHDRVDYLLPMSDTGQVVRTFPYDIKGAQYGRV